MAYKYSIIYVFLWFSLILRAQAQENSTVRFGHVAPEDFSLSGVKVDTTYGAVILADIGNSSFEGNTKGWFTLVFKHRRRIRVTGKQGIPLATVEIPLYKSTNGEDKETIENLRGITYNLEHGQVTETPLGKDALYQDRISKNTVIKKFTMPRVKEGSIIEYSYTIQSDYLRNLQPWRFQGSYPRVWSEYQVHIPQFFEYVFLAQGDFPFDIRKTDREWGRYRVSIPTVGLTNARPDVAFLESNTTVNRWVCKNVPALKTEVYTTSVENHVTKMAFQMSGQSLPETPHRDILGSWQSLADRLLSEQEFGEEITRNNSFLDPKIKEIQKEAPDQLSQAKLAFNWVKKTFKSQGSRNILLSKSLREIFSTKNGYETDLNILLVALLKRLGIPADPVILSTRSNGYATYLYPFLDQYDYVVCQAQIDHQAYYLDASNPVNGFNKLPLECYNGSARVISNPSVGVILSPDSIQETKMTRIELRSKPGQPGYWTGDFTTSQGDFESQKTRQIFLDNGKETFEKNLGESYPNGTTIDSITYQGETIEESPLQIQYKIKIKQPSSASLVYFSPMMNEGYKENPFKSPDRLYPVEIPYKMDEIYQISIDVPPGFKVEEVPKSVRLSLNGDEGYFEYLVFSSPKEVSLRARLRLKRAIFPKQDYASLKDFFGFVVKKHAEPIIFKKL